MPDKLLATLSTMPLLEKLHVGAAFLIVVAATIQAGIPGFVLTGLWMACSFAEKTRWLFYGMLLAQAWSNWHIMGLVLAAAFVVFCVQRNLIYKKNHPEKFSAIGRTRSSFDPSDLDFQNSLDRMERDRAERDAAHAWQEEVDRQNFRRDIGIDD